MSLQTSIENSSHAQNFGQYPAEALAQSAHAERLLIPIQPLAFDLFGIFGRAAYVQHHIVTEAGKLISGPPSFQIDLHAADLREALRQRTEKLGSNHELVFLSHFFLHTLPKHVAAQRIGRLI